MRPLGIFTAAAVAAAALTVAGPLPQARAEGWSPWEQMSSNVSTGEVQVVSTGYGDAVAAWVGFTGNSTSRVFVAEMTDGEWDAPHPVGVPDGLVFDLDLAVNNGHLAVAYADTAGGAPYSVKVVRNLADAGGTYTALTVPRQNWSFPRFDIVLGPDGSVGVASDYQTDQNAPKLIDFTAWSSLGVTASSSRGNGSAPEIDRNDAGQIVLAYDDGNDVSYQYFQPGQGWTPEASAILATDMAVTIADDGYANVVYATADGVTRAGLNPGGAPDGLFGVSQDDNAIRLVADTWGGDKRMRVIAWAATVNGLATVGVSRYSGTEFAGDTVHLPATGGASQIGVASQSGERRLVSFVSGDDTSVYTSGLGLEPWESRLSAGNGYAASATGMSASGDLVLVGRSDVPGAPLGVRFWDTKGPQTALGGWNVPVDQRIALTDLVTYQISATDDLSEVLSRVPRTLTASWKTSTFTETLGDPTGDDGAASHAPKPGETTCFAPRSSDTVGNVGQAASAECFHFPLDDKQLQGKGWKRVAQKGHYLSSVSTTTAKGRVLVKTGVVVQRLGIVVAKSANGGRIAVFWNKKKLGEVSLKGTGKRVVVPIREWSTPKTGTVRIKVISPSGKVVKIDGLVVDKLWVT